MERKATASSCGLAVAVQMMIGSGRVSHDAAGRFEAVQPRHVHVHDHHIGANAAGIQKVECCLAIIHRADNLDGRIGIQQLFQQHPIQL